MSETVNFAYLNNYKAYGALPDIDILHDELRERGVEPVVSEYAEKAFGTAGRVEVASPHGNRFHAQTMGSLALGEDGVGCVVNLANRSLKGLEGLPPVINEPKVRALGHYKDRGHAQVLEPAGIAIPTALISNVDEIEKFRDEAGNQKWYLKPRIGDFGKGGMVVRGIHARMLFEDNPKWYNNYLLQPAYDFTSPLPEEIVPYDDAKGVSSFQEHNVPGVTKELRMYGFQAAGQPAQVFPVGRALGDKDRWFFVDPESVPDELTEGAQRAFALAAAAGKATALYGTVDFGYGHRHNTPDQKEWVAIEANLRMPHLVGAKEHGPVAVRLRSMFADLIKTVVSTPVDAID